MRSLIQYILGTKEKAVERKPVYSFSETETATGSSSWHIRKLTNQGKKLGGGADTLALCGAKVCWDLNVEITEHHLSQNTCKKCVEKYWENVPKNI